MNDPTGQRFSPFKEPAGTQLDRRTVRLRMIWLMALALVGAFIGLQIPREFGRWELASAMILRARGDKEAAYEKLNAAMQWFPDSPELLLQRAEWKLNDKRPEEALADCNTAIERAPKNRGLLKARGHLLMKAGRFAEAVKDLRELERFSRRVGRPPLYESLNELAYAQALAKADLNEALQHADEALELMPAASEKKATDDYYEKAIILDTRGFIQYLRQEYESALDDLNPAAKRADEQLDEMRQKLTNAGQKETSARYKTMAEGVAVIHYHRSLVLAALGRQEEADREHDIAKKLAGREPDETLF